MAGRSLGVLTLDLIAKIGGFEQGLDRAARIAKQRGEAINAALATIGKTALAVGAATATSIGLMTASTVRAAGEIRNLAALSGTSAERFQEMASGARRYGVEQDKLADIFKDTQDKVGDFVSTGGGAMADFFERIAPLVGVTAEQFRELSGPDALQLYYTSLERANVSQSEMTFYLEAIASDASALAPLLRNNGKEFDDLGRKAREAGAVMTTAQVNAAMELERSLGDLRTSVAGVTTEVGVAMIPALNDLASLVRDESFKDGFRFLADILVDITRGVAGAVSAIGGLVGNAGRLQRVEERLAGFREALENPDKRGWFVSEDSLLQAIARAEKQRAEILKDIADQKKEVAAGAGLPTVPSVPGSVSRPGIVAPKGGAAKESDFQREADRLREQIALYGKTGEAARLSYQLAQGGLAKLAPSEKAHLMALATELDAKTKAAEADEKRRAVAEALKGAYDSQLDTYRRQLELGQEATELERVRYEILSGNLKGLEAGQRDMLETLAAEVDARNKAADAARKQVEQERFLAGLRDEVGAAQRDADIQVAGVGMGDRRRAMFEERMGIEAEYARRRTDLAQAQLSAETRLSDEAYAQAIEALRAAEQAKLDIVLDTDRRMAEAQGDWQNGAVRALENYRDEAADLAKQSEQLFTDIFSGAEDALVSFVQTGKLSFKELGQSIMNDLVRSGVKNAVASLFGSLSGMGGAGGLMGALGSIFAGGRASGGPVMPGRAYLVGERGPELIVPGASAHVVDAERTSGLLAGRGVSQVFNVTTPDADSFRRSQRQIARQARRGLRT